MKYPYIIRPDKNKVTVGMARRLQGGSLDALADIVAALSVDAAGAKPERAAALAAFDELTLDEVEEITDKITEAFTTPKAI